MYGLPMSKNLSCEWADESVIRSLALTVPGSPYALAIASLDKRRAAGELVALARSLNESRDIFIVRLPPHPPNPPKDDADASAPAP